MNIKKIRTRIAAFALVFLISSPMEEARADFWGGDLVFLSQILQQAIVQVQALNSILGTGKDTLNFMRDLNKGLSDALVIINTANRTLRPGNFSDLNGISEVIREMEALYGRIPQTSESRLQSTQDMSIAESIELHNDAFKYADQIDPEAERLKDYAGAASPQGAAKASLQAQGIQIHVLNQILRTQAALLKIQSESLAMQNRRSKLQSEQFRAQYNELSNSLQGPKPGFDLPSLNQNL